MLEFRVQALEVDKGQGARAKGHGSWVATSRRFGVRVRVTKKDILSMNTKYTLDILYYTILYYKYTPL